MIQPSESNKQSVRNGARALLRVLEKKPYYTHRFLGQVQALYGTESSGQTPDISASMYVNGAIGLIPEDLRAGVAIRACELIVNSCIECPSPVELRGFICESAIQELGASLSVFLERAKLFFSFPPAEQTIADRWPERVLYTTVARIGREQFASITLDAWKRELATTMFDSPDSLRSYVVPEKVSIEKVKRDFKSCLISND